MLFSRCVQSIETGTGKVLLVDKAALRLWA